LLRSRVECLVKLEGVDDLKDLFRIQGRLRALRDIDGLQRAVEFQIGEEEKAVELEKLKNENSNRKRSIQTWR
jgi:hypothetical protein